MDAGLGETIIYKPLYEIFKSYDIYKKINLPINIFLLTDGEINDKPKVIDIIEKNNEKFKIYSIGMGNKFDEDLIKAAGSIGKGTYSFCKDLKFLNSIVIKGLINAATSFVTGFELENNLDDKNILKNCSYNSIIKDEELICEQYILSKEDADKMKDIKINIKYTDNKKNEIKKEYNIIPEKIPKGDELSKLIVYDYIRKKDFSFIEGDKKIKLALKYQLLIESTSLYAEIELSNKINKEMKIQILGNPNKIELKKDIISLLSQGLSVRFRKLRMHESDNEDENSDDDWDDCIKGNKNCDIKNKGEVNLEKDIIDKKNCNNEIIKKEEEIVDKNISNINKKDLFIKEDIMNMINTQDFIKGFWEENEYTIIIKEKYIKEYNSLKELKDININNRLIMTILVILFINKEQKELLDELFMIIKKAKIFIQKETNDSYENIIKKIGIN